MNPSPKVPTPKAPMATTLRHGESRCQRRSASISSSSATRRAAACAARRRPAGRGRGRRRSRRLRPPRRFRSIACFARGNTNPPRVRPPYRHGRGRGRRAPALAHLVERVEPRARGRLAATSRTGASRPSTSAPRLASRRSARRCWRSRATTTSRSPPARFTSTFAEFERQWETTEPTTPPPALHVVGLNSVRPWRHQSGGSRRSSSAGGGAAAGGGAGAFRVVALHHH